VASSLPSWGLTTTWSPKGLIFIVTPDVGSMAARLLGKYWHHIKPNEHLAYFSKSTMEKLLARHEFEVVVMKHVARWRKIKTIIEKSESLLGSAPPIWLPEMVGSLILPFNVHDELCILARKKA